MNWANPTRLLVTLAVAAGGVALPVMDTAARSKKQPVAEAPPPPPPPPPGAVGLPDRLIADAGAYAAYLQRATATSPAALTSGASVSQALKTDAAYDPDALIRGAVAYAAVAALQDPTFVSQVRNAGTSPENRQLMVGYVIRDPAYVFMFKGSDAAAGLAKEALGGAGLRLYAAGAAIKLSAYSVQHQTWSKEEVVDRPGRLAAVKASAMGPMPQAGDQTDLLRMAQTGVAPLGISAGPASPPYTPLVARALQLAAIAAMGEATDAAYDRLTYLTSDASTSTCLNMAKLNLYQCLAVSKPHYEDIFCLGQHVMLDTGSCLARNAGVATPVEAPPPASSPAPKTMARAGARG